MAIIPQSTGYSIEEHDRILRRLLAERAPEWQRLSGLRRLLTRFRIEVWAWRQAGRELQKDHDKNDRYKIY